MLRAADFRRQAWDSLSGNWGTAVLLTLVYLLINFALGFTMIGAILLTGTLIMGYNIYALKTARGDGSGVETLFEGFSSFVRSLVLYITNEILIFLWSLLFFIPGIIKTYSYSMAYFIMEDHPDISANDARKASMDMMRGNKWRLFCLDFSFIGWYILSALTFGILTLWVTPYNMVAHAQFYQSLLDEGYTPDIA